MQAAEQRAVRIVAGLARGRGVVHPELEIRADAADGVAPHGVIAEQGDEFEETLAESVAPAAELLARGGLAGEQPGAVGRGQARQIDLRRGRAAQNGKLLRAPFLHRMLVRGEREKGRAEHHDDHDPDDRGPDMPARKTHLPGQPPAPPAQGREVRGQRAGEHFPCQT